jgi:hypothetical protein
VADNLESNGMTDPVVDAIRQRLDRLERVYERWPAYGVCQILVADEPAEAFFVLGRGGSKPQVALGQAPHPDLTLTLTGEVLRALARGQARLTELLNEGDVRISGDSSRVCNVFDLFSPGCIEVLEALQRVDAQMRSRSPAMGLRRLREPPTWTAVQAALCDDGPTIFEGALARVAESLQSLDALDAGFGGVGVLSNTGPVRLAELISRIRAYIPGKESPPRTGRYGAYPVPGKIAAYLAEHWRPLPDGRVAFPEFFLSAAGVVTHLHRDLPGGVIAQFFGRKRWVVFPPSDSRFLYPQFTLAEGFQHCEPDVGRPDLEKFPQLASAHPLEIFTEASDLLILPAAWFHYVETSETSLGVRLNVVPDWYRPVMKS